MHLDAYLLKTVNGKPQTPFSALDAYRRTRTTAYSFFPFAMMM